MKRRGMQTLFFIAASMALCFYSPRLRAEHAQIPAAAAADNLDLKDPIAVKTFLVDIHNRNLGMSYLEEKGRPASEVEIGTKLCELARGGDLDQIKQFLDKEVQKHFGKDLSEVNKQDKYDYINKMVNFRSKHGDLPLHVSAVFFRKSAFSWFLACGADPESLVRVGPNDYRSAFDQLIYGKEIFRRFAASDLLRQTKTPQSLKRWNRTEKELDPKDIDDTAKDMTALFMLNLALKVDPEKLKTSPLIKKAEALEQILATDRGEENPGFDPTSFLFYSTLSDPHRSKHDVRDNVLFQKLFESNSKKLWIHQVAMGLGPDAYGEYWPNYFDKVGVRGYPGNAPGNTGPKENPLPVPRYLLPK